MNEPKTSPPRQPRRRLRLLFAVSLVLVLGTLGLLGYWYEPDPGDGAPSVLVAVDRTMWNTLGLNQFTYVRALRQQGLRPVLVKYPQEGDSQTSPSLASLWSDSHLGLVLTGGGDVAAEAYGGDPDVSLAVSEARDTFELALLESANGRNLPILGLCRGAQLMNVWAGGTLGDHRDQSERFAEHRKILSGHPIILAASSRLHRIYQGSRIEEVTTWHGQFVEVPGEEVRITAYAEDGTPEAIEMDGEVFRIGVQWHAEMPPWDDTNDPLFAAYAEAVRQASTKQANKRR